MIEIDYVFNCALALCVVSCVCLHTIHSLTVHLFCLLFFFFYIRCVVLFWFIGTKRGRERERRWMREINVSVIVEKKNRIYFPIVFSASLEVCLYFGVISCILFVYEMHLLCSCPISKRPYLVRLLGTQLIFMHMQCIPHVTHQTQSIYKQVNEKKTPSNITATRAFFDSMRLQRCIACCGGDADEIWPTLTNTQCSDDDTHALSYEQCWRRCVSISLAWMCVAGQCVSALHTEESLWWKWSREKIKIK